jgi:transposase-like protein
MPKHKSEDYKLSAVEYYLKNDVSMEYVCNIFGCKKQSFSRQQGIIDTNEDGIIETDEKTGDLVVDTPNQSLPTSYINNNPYNAPTTWPKHQIIICI